MIDSNSDLGFDIYLDLPGTSSYAPSSISSSDSTYSLRSFAWKSTKILNTATAMNLSSHRRKQQPSYPLSWNSQDWNPSENIPYDADPAQPFTDSDHFNPTSSLGMPRSGYCPRQSIPSDVSTPTRSFSEAEASTDPHGIYRGGKHGSFAIKRWEDYDTTLKAIDPAAFSAIVNFDYSCLDDLDEELILRPKNAFADLCWSAAVLRHPSSFQRPSTSKNPLPSQSTQRPPCLEGSMTKDSVPPPYSYISPATKDTGRIRGSLEVDIFSVSDDDRDSVDTGMETDRLSSTSCGSVEYSAVTMVTGRRSLNTLEAHLCSDEENTSTGVVVVPPDSMSPIPIHDNSADSRIDVTSRYVDLSGKNWGQPMRRKEKIDADAGSFISFEAGDDASPQTPQLTPSPPTQHFSSFLVSSLHAYAGVANHRESIGFFPIPAAESKSASKFGQSLKLSSKNVGSLRSSVSRLCHPLSSRVVKG